MSTPQNRARRSDGKVRVAIVGVGNCASSLVQGAHSGRISGYTRGRCGL